MIEWTEVTVSIPNWEWETYAIIAYSVIGVIVFMGLVRTIPSFTDKTDFSFCVFLSFMTAILWLPMLAGMLPLYLLIKIARIGKKDD